jgi:hypothetical protein
MRLARTGSLVAALPCLLTLQAGCGGAGGGGPRSCTGAGECGATGRCLDGACVENAAPVAVLAAPDGLRALDLAEIDGSASSDPDAVYGDQIQAFHWSFTSLDGACAAPAVTGTGALARVRFGCQGRFRVELVAVDALGKESAPASAELTVGPHAGDPAVLAGADQVVDHACSGSPVTCTTAGGGLALTAQLAAGVVPLGAVTYRWTVDPPQSGPLDEHEVVTFSPSAGAQNVSALLEVDETAVAAIVDDWVFRVTASDEAGPLGEATTRVSVGNRPPVLAAAAASAAVDHTYSGGSYRASSRVSRWSDPDGDPLTPAGDPTGSSVCSSYWFQADGTAVVECARAFTGTPDLSGFVTLHRVSVRPKDPWVAAGAASSSSVTIHNRPVSAMSSTVTGSTYCIGGGITGSGECCMWESEPGVPSGCIKHAYHCVETSVPLSPALSDPDGDPVTVTWTGNAFVAQTVVCEPGSCTGVTNPIPAYDGCTRPTGSLTGTFSATDGLSTSSGTLTFNYQ